MKTRDEFDETTQAVAATWVKLCRAQMAVSARVMSRLPGRMSLPQFAVMEALDSLGPMCHREISEKILKSAGNVTVVVDNLEKRGFAKRIRAGEDRRKYMVHLTRSGHKWVAEVLRGYMDALVEEFSALTSDERDELGRLCRKLGLGKRG